MRAIVVIAMSIMLLVSVMIILSSGCVNNDFTMMLITIEMTITLTLAYDLIYMLTVNIACCHVLS